MDNWPAQRKKSPERACKPNPVPGRGRQRTLRSSEPPAAVAIIPLGPRSPSGSSSRPGDVPREAGRDGRPPSPYLALLRMGFTVPPPLPSGRCALTAPFHPYRPVPKGTERRFLFCGTFLRVAATGCYPACCPFGVRTFLPGRPGRSRGPLGAAPTLARAPRPAPRTDFHRSRFFSSSKYCSHASTSTFPPGSRGAGALAAPKRLQKSPGESAFAPLSRALRTSSRSAVTTVIS